MNTILPFLLVLRSFKALNVKVNQRTQDIEQTVSGNMEDRLLDVDIVAAVARPLGDRHMT